jgi:hypothetical protein
LVDSLYKAILQSDIPVDSSGGASRKILWGQSAYVGSECILRQDLYTNMYILKGFSKKAVGSADPTANTQLRRWLIVTRKFGR